VSLDCLAEHGIYNEAGQKLSNGAAICRRELACRYRTFGCPNIDNNALPIATNRGHHRLYFPDSISSAALAVFQSWQR
jgi:hypothetical protein